MRDLLSYVRRPSRYIGPEPNASVKQHDSVRLKAVLVYPDMYEIGMANLGLRILYERINDLPYALAERAYLPGDDMESIMRRHGEKLSTMETDTPLDQFDIIGITLQTELNYVNALHVLRLSGLEHRSADRERPFPLVIGGGSCAFNPEPVADFFDAFVIGDGEEAAIEIVDSVIECKKKGLSKTACLDMLSHIEGVYVPSLYKQATDDYGRFKAVVPDNASPGRVRRRILPDINGVVLRRPIIPFIRPVHDRLVVEIARGCTRGCRFCQAGMIYRPVREKDMNTVLKEIRDNVALSGFSDISLLSLSAGDYTMISPLLRAFMSEFSGDRCSVSLPSLRTDSVTGPLLEQIRQVRKTGFTVAIEAGTQRMRDVINKNITEDGIIASVGLAARMGWQTIKLYFMLGLPFETDDDVAGMGELINRVHDAVRKYSGKTRINASISAFIPKPHTPFQWSGMIAPEEFRRKLSIVKNAVRGKRVVIKHQMPEISVIEAVLARADRRIGPVIEEIARHGLTAGTAPDVPDAPLSSSRAEPHHTGEACNADDNSAYRNDLRVWLDAIASCGLSLPDLLGERDADQPLPWDHIDTLIPRSFLRQEYEKARGGLVTKDCFQSVCTDCGVCDFKRVEPRASAGSYAGTSPANGARGQHRERPHQWTTDVRVQYTKSGLMRFLGHLELIDFIMHALHRTGLPMAYTSGFHPKPVVSFSDPIPAGIESSAEYMDIKLYGDTDADEVLGALGTAGHDGLEFVGAASLPYGAIPVSVAIRAVHYELALDAIRSCTMSILGTAIDLLLDSERFMVPVSRKDREGELDIRPFIEVLNAERNGRLFMVIRKVNNRLIGAIDIIEKGLGIPYGDIISAPLKKVAVEFDHGR
ncbi:MAG: TIGR03960 family B12-binding radical SAM protein [Deltaproteobacteria bacterium]|nr:TIGR03960 family B12-binding radical SAM protein [Deltaproteobacteria bacterium]MCL5278106.1 TIGR03960 family B12-binding radical SAM protein [Deltaproteobacteria bacterium]